MARERSSEQQRALIGVVAGRHPDTVKRYVQGLPVSETTGEQIEIAARELQYEHIIVERLRSLAARKGQ
jgi:DNA-binding LacI/PurR family transcriptional regulator